MSANRSFKSKLLAVQLIAFIPLLLFIFYIFDLWYDTARSSVLNNAINETRLAANTVEESFNFGVNISTILSTSPVVISGLDEKSSLLDGTLRAIITNLDEIKTLMITDTAGKYLAYSGALTPEQKRDTTIADREYFQEVMETKKTVVSDPIIGKIRGKQTIAIVVPVKENGKVTAVVGSAYDMDILKAKLEKVMPENEKQTFLLYDKSGRLVFTLNKPIPNEEEKLLFNNLPIMAKDHKAKISIIENQKLPNSDKTYLGAIAPVANYGWTVVNLISTEEIFTPLYKTQAVTWLILLSALLFALSLISYVLRKIKMVY